MFNSLRNGDERILQKMLGLGTSITSTSGSLFGGLPLAIINAAVVVDMNDETILYQFLSTSAESNAAIIAGKTLGAGNLMNGTVELTVTNETADPPKTGVRTFNIFQLVTGNTNFFFLSGATSNITISDTGEGGDYYEVDITTDGTGSDAFLTAGGDNANLDASADVEEYTFSAVLILDGFLNSTALVSSSLTIDPA